jgi:mono/diheme cytochrome c family protein
MDGSFLRSPFVNRPRRWMKFVPIPYQSGVTGRAVLAVVIATLLLMTICNEARTQGAARQKSSPSSFGDAKNGKFIFASRGCNKCHGSEGEGVSRTAQNGGVPQIASTSLALTTFVELVRKPNGQMPPFDSQQVSDSDLADVYAFLKSLKGTAEHDPTPTANTENGQRLFTTYGCYECHGSQGQGSQQTGGPRLGPPQIPLSAFVAYVRQPTGQMPPYTTKTASTESLADMYAFLKSLPQPPRSNAIPLLNQ